MSHGVASRGMVVPDVGSGGGGGGSGPSGLKILFLVKDLDGNLVTGASISGASDIKISTNGGTWSNRAGSAPTEVGRGLYYYIPDLAEISGTDGTIVLSLNKSGTYLDPMESQDYGTLTTDAQNTLNAAITTAQNAVQGTVSAAQTAIESNTNSDVTAAQTAITAAITAAQTAIDAHTDSDSTTIQAAITTAYNNLIANMPASVWSHTIGQSTSARQIMMGMLATMLSKALGLSTEAFTFYGPDNVTVLVSGTMNDNGDRLVTLNLGPA